MQLESKGDKIMTYTTNQIKGFNAMYKLATADKVKQNSKINPKVDNALHQLTMIDKMKRNGG